MKSKYFDLCAYKHHLCVMLAGVCLLTVADCRAQLYRDSTASVDARVNDLLSRMTPEEKFWQVFMLAGEFAGDISRFHDGLCGLQMLVGNDPINLVARANAIQTHFVEDTRLGIPVIFFAEALHGLVQEEATVFPQSIGLAASFDTTVMHNVASAIAEECRSRGVRQVLSPVVNIASDVRWGRTEETYGEDPFLTSEMGAAFVSEFEQLGVVATPKHFVANVGDGGRDSYPIQISERLLREVYLPPFEACIRRGARSIMTSYNSYDGSPCSANDWLNNRLLKQELGFRGMVISDACAVGGANVLHFTASDYADAGMKAMESGLDAIFQTSMEHHSLFDPPFLNGQIPQSVIDSAVVRVLRVKFELSLFEHPYVDPAKWLPPGSVEHQQLARRAAQESLVLLKNTGGVLPLTKSIHALAVIGPDADTARMGGYSAPTARAITILDGIKRRAGSAVDVQYVKGCERTFAMYRAVPASCLILKGDYFDNIELSGAPVLTRSDTAIDFDWTLFSPDAGRLPCDNYSVRWTGLLKSPVSGHFRLGIEGNDGYRLYLNDSLLIDNWRKVSAGVKLAEVDLVANSEERLRLEYFEPSGSARIKLVWNVDVPANEDSRLQQAVDLAKHCDATVLVVGIEEGEFHDRALLALPEHQEALIHRVAALAKPTVVVLVGGSAVAMAAWLNEVSAVLDAWYPGEQGGVAVGDVLFGDSDPAGRLPITFPLSEGQLPLVYNHKPTGRGDDYMEMRGQPLFPFGFGLSYTTFEYSKLTVEPSVVASGESATASFVLKNTGLREGDEVVQLYVRDMLASVAQPVMELKGFQRVHLNPGERKVISFRVTPEMLAMLDKNLNPVIEPGDFRIMIGASSKDLRVKSELKVIRLAQKH
jgi:beta-glucosidase